MSKDVAKILEKNRKLVRDAELGADIAKNEAEALIARNKALVALNVKSEMSKELLRILPQGHGSGLDADTVDGLHAMSIIAKAQTAGGGGGSGSGSGDATSIQGKTVDIAGRVDDTIIVYKTVGDKYIHETKSAPAAHKTTHQDGGSDEISVAALSGELADPQTPKAHNQALATITGHDKAAHDALGINADLVDSCHAGLVANNVFKILAAIATGDIFYIDATPQVARLPKGTDGQILKLVSGLPTWQTEGAGTNHEILSATHTDSLAASVLRGDIIIGNSTPKWARLAKGAQYTALIMGANDPAWALITNNSIDAAAAIVESKLALNYATHPQAHTLASHSTKAHSELTNVGEDDHHTKFTIAEHDTTVRHSLGSVVPHDALASLTEKSHTNLTDKGTNTHAQIDTHVAAAAPHSGHEATANKAQASGYCDLDASVKVPAARMPTAKIKTTLSFAVTGTLTTGADKAPTIVAPCALTIVKVKVVVKTAPTGASLIVDVNKAGTTIFTNQANRPEIAIGETTDDSGTPDVTALAEGDKLTIDIDQIGSTIAGADLTVEVVADQGVVFS